MNPQPKPVKRSTVKRKRTREHRTQMEILRESVIARERFDCRIGKLLKEFGFTLSWRRPLELAHIVGRGAGGEDTTANTLMLRDTIHQGPRSHHSGHLKIRPLTDKGADGPCCFEFYEKLPTEL